MMKIPNQYKYIQRYAKIYQMTNTKYHDKTWNVEQQSINQLMSIETHRHLKSTNISKYGTKINKIMQQMHKHKTKHPNIRNYPK